MSLLTRCATLWAAALFATPLALAQTPAPAGRVVKLIVPYAAGGGTDILGRQLAEVLGPELKLTMIVENKPGAGTTLGAQEVARAAPDGNTLLLGDLALAVNPSLFHKMPYDPQKDLAPVALVAAAPLVLVVGKQSGVTTVKDLVARAKAEPGKLSFASAGIGNPPHLAGELFRLTTDTNIVHVPYKGVGPALNDVLGGHVTMLFTGISSTKQHIDAGSITALAVTGAQRAPTLPNIPTITEAGFAAADVTSWWGLFAPPTLPPDQVQGLAQATERVLKAPTLQDKLRAQNIAATYGGPEAMRAKLKSETGQWARVIRAANIQPE